MNFLKRLFWPGFVVTLLVYGTMLAWSLPFIAAEANGIPPFDMRPTGYSFQEAREFLGTLSPEGRDFYLEVQHRLDLAYPALIAFTLFSAIVLLTPSRLGALRYPLALLPVAGSIFDYLENHSVAEMLAVGADGLTAELASRANIYTVLKSGLTTAAMLVTLTLLATYAARRWLTRDRGVQA